MPGRGTQAAARTVRCPAHARQLLCLQRGCPIDAAIRLPSSPRALLCRSVARVGSRPYAAAYLTLAREEVEEGLAAHELCPQPLREWMKHEGGLGTTAGQFL